MTKKPVILFDGMCGLCSRWVQFVIRHDKADLFRFAPLQSNQAGQFLMNHGIPANELSTMVLCLDEKCFTKSDAALEIARRLSGVWKWAALFLIVPKFLRDWVYDLIAKNRHRFFNQKESCQILGPERLERFL